MATDEELDPNAPVAQIQAPPEALAALGTVGQAPAPAPQLAAGGQVAPLPQSAPAGPDATPISFDPAASAAPAAPPSVPAAVPVPPPIAAAGVDTRALDQARQSAYGVAQAQADQGKAEGDQLTAESEAQGKLADVAHDQSIDAQAEIQSQKDGLAEARKAADQAAQEVKDFKFHNYFEGETTGQKIAAALFVGLGGIGAGLQARVNPNAKNMALEAIDANVSQDFEKQKQKLATKQNFASYKERGVQDLTGQYRDDLAKLQLQQGLAYKAVADQAQAQLLAQKVPLAEAQNNTLVQSLRAKGDETYATGFQQLVRDKATLALEKAKLGVSYGELGVARQNADTAAARAAAEGEAKKAAARDKAAAENEKISARVVHVNGEPIGLSPSSRQTQAVEDRAVQYDDAEKSLSDWLDYHKTDPIKSRLASGDRANRAILAVAATTTANSSDRTTQHEANTLTNVAGLMDPDAVKRTLEHIRERKRSFLANLSPLPDGYSEGRADDTSAAPVSRSPTQTATPTQLAPQYIARAKAVLADPSKYSAADVARAKKLTGQK